ncbi:hypothetical protein ACOSQ4_026807 [Xanthoceras sorbifolium]
MNVVLGSGLCWRECWCGKVLSTKQINCEAFRGVIPKVWVVQELDEGATGDYLKKFPRVRVLVDINKPLKRCIRIDAMGSVKETIILLHYERLLKHFFSYGMLGYLVQECPDDEIGVPRVSSECYPYGSWLRASSPVKMLASRSHRLEVLSGDVFNGTVLVKSEDHSRVHKSGSTSHGEGSLRESFVEALPNVGSDVLHGSVSAGVFPSSVFRGAQEGCIESQLNGLEEGATDHGTAITEMQISFVFGAIKTVMGKQN